MKKFLLILLSLLLIIGLFSCEGKSNDEEDSFEVSESEWEKAVRFDTPVTKFSQHVFYPNDTSEDSFIYRYVVEIDGGKLHHYETDENGNNVFLEKFYLKDGGSYTQYRKQNGHWLATSCDESSYKDCLELLYGIDGAYGLSDCLRYEDFTFDSKDNSYKCDEIITTAYGEDVSFKNVVLKFENGKLIRWYFEMTADGYNACDNHFEYKPLSISLPQIPSENYVIGFSGPLSGGAAMYGIAVKNSAQMAIDEINAKGGLNGVKFELIFRDDVHDATNIERNFTQLLADGMQISLGTVTTKPGLAFKALAKEQNLFYLTPSASGDDIPVPSMGYQMCFADSSQGKAAADFLNRDYAGKKIGVFYKSDDDYSKGIYEKFELTLSAELKANMVVASFTTGTSTDFSAQVNALKDCDVIFMPIYYTPASLFMTQGVGIVKANAIYYGCDGLNGIDAIDGFDISSIPQEISYLASFNPNAVEGPAAAYIANYKARFGENAPLNQFGASAYDCVYAIYGALKRASDAGVEVSPSLSVSELCDILSAQFNGNYTFSGVTGDSVTWSSSGFANKFPAKYVVKNAD